MAFGALVLAYVLGLAAAARAGLLPWWVLVVLLALNVLTALAYGRDKHAARTRGWRLRESTLHWLAFAGGWPAARVAQLALRHKSSKREFLAAYWWCVAAHLAAMAAAAWLLMRK